MGLEVQIREDWVEWNVCLLFHKLEVGRESVSTHLMSQENMSSMIDDILVMGCRRISRNVSSLRYCRKDDFLLNKGKE